MDTATMKERLARITDELLTEAQFAIGSCGFGTQYYTKRKEKRKERKKKGIDSQLCTVILSFTRSTPSLSLLT